MINEGDQIIWLEDQGRDAPQPGDLGRVARVEGKIFWVDWPDGSVSIESTLFEGQEWEHF